MRIRKLRGELAIVSAALMFFSIIPPCIANNMRVENTVVMPADAGKAKIQFDIAWDNSWLFRHINHDAAWVFFKALVKGSEGEGWKHVTLSGSGVNPAGYSTGTGGKDFEIVVPEDGMGLFFQRSASNAGAGNIAVSNVVVVWDLAKSGISPSMKMRIQTLALEMCYVPEGAFWVGEEHPVANSGKFHMGGDRSKPFQITSENALVISNSAGNLYAIPPILDGTLPKEFPKGYAAFYCMKYEMTQGQYADFLNTLTPAQAARREYVQWKGIVYTITWSNGVYAAGAPDRVCNYQTWMDGVAFADWAGLRPMTELEFEKACRGPLYPVPFEYAWGSTDLVWQTAVDTTDGPYGSGRERALSAEGGRANNFGSFSGMRGGFGLQRAGIYATNGADRASAGATYWGIMELTGSLWEKMVSLAPSSIYVEELAGGPGRLRGHSFAGTHGDGVLSATGNATNPDWPGWNNATGDVMCEYGVGQRGGRWTDAPSIGSQVAQRAPGGRWGEKGIDFRMVNDNCRSVRTAPPR